MNPMIDAKGAEIETSGRERLREIIRSEVAKANPIDDSRRPLELIVETSVRLSEKDDGSVEVIDDHGRLRSGLTIQDVLDELRARHPTLFKPQLPRAAAPPRPGITVVDAPVDAPLDAAAPPDAPPAASDAEARPLTRDWLRIGSGQPLTGGSPVDADEEEEPRRPITAVLQEQRRALGKLTEGTGARLGAAAGALSARLRMARGNVSHSLEGVQAEVFRDRSSRLSAGHALGAVAGVLALALIAYFVYSIARLPFGSGLTDPSRTAQAPVAEPAETGAVSAGSTSTASLTAPAEANPLHGIPEVLDTATLWLQGKIVHLYGVEWVRGGGDPDEFTRYLRGREVACDPVGSADAYRCKVDGKDLSEVVLFNGGGRTTSDAPPELRAAEDKARTAKIGVWSK
jgi:hypothetical protein